VPAMNEQCWKVRYASKHAAKQALRNFRGSYAEVRVYFCDYGPGACHGWHMTKSERRGRDRWY
jgi:hypothetical protein